MSAANSKLPRRAAIYVRQSLSHLDGIERQIDLCKSLCVDRGWDVVEIYEDNDVSASKSRASNTAWAKMLRDIPSGRFEIVVAVDLDRLLRRVADLTTLTDTGVRVLTVNGEIDLTTADGQFRATMLASIAQFETRRKSERQLRANLARSTSGKPVPTRRRYGYETDGCTPRESEAKEVRRLFEEFRRGESIRSLAIDLRKREVDPGGGKGWPVNRVRNILGNPFYGGQVFHLGEVIDSEFVKPVVPRELAIEVRAILADPARKTSPGSAIRHELTGIAKCGVCGAFLHYMNDYMCGKALNHVSIKKYKLEPLVMWTVHQVLSEKSDLEASSRGVSSELEAMLLESATLSEEIRLCQEMVFWDGADRVSLKSKIAKLGARREILEQAIETERSTSALGAIVREVRALWLQPIDGTGYSLWKENMVSVSKALGQEVDESLITPEVYELKTRVERRAEAWPAFWRGLSLDARREVIKALLDIKVNKGRDLDRVVISELES